MAASTGETGSEAADDGEQAASGGQAERRRVIAELDLHFDRIDYTSRNDGQWPRIKFSDPARGGGHELYVCVQPDPRDRSKVGYGSFSAVFPPAKLRRLVAHIIFEEDPDFADTDNESN